MDAKERDIKQFYKTLDLTRVKNSKNVKNELMYQLYKTPKEKIKPIIEPAYRNDTHQYDLLYLPHDNGYKYALVAVDEKKTIPNNAQFDKQLNTKHVAMQTGIIARISGRRSVVATSYRS